MSNARSSTAPIARVTMSRRGQGSFFARQQAAVDEILHLRMVTR